MYNWLVVGRAAVSYTHLDVYKRQRFARGTRVPCGRRGLTFPPFTTIIGGAKELAQKVTGFIKLQIPAGKATPAPPVGPALGQHGVNLSLIHIFAGI